MSVQELNVVHRRYIRLSNHFKSAWTFHQFLQGLRKAFGDLPEPANKDEFQALYNDLKVVSDHLSANTAEKAQTLLEDVESRFGPLVDALLETEAEASPQLLRRFFQRVKNYDDNILSQLVKFYLYSDVRTGEDGWTHDRIDKADYLTTKLAEAYQDWKDAFVLRDQTHLRELSQGLASALSTEPMDAEEAGRLREQTASLRAEITATESVDQLHDTRVVQRYRDFKHDLGRRFFDPQLLLEILATNIELKNHVHRLYKRDEQRIIAEYQQVFELEREAAVDSELSGELKSFRDVVERFESQLEGENVKIEDVAELRRQVRHLIPKLRAEDDTEVPVAPPREVRELRAEEEGGEVIPRLQVGDDLADYVDAAYARVIDALDDTTPTQEPKRAALQPEVFGLGIRPREVVAYRRIFGEAECEQRLEMLLLAACALRVRIEAEVEEIKGILDDTAISRDAPIFRTARITCRHADHVVRRLEHEMEQKVLESDGDEARALLGLKMRMLRAFSGLWLMVHH